MKHFIATSLLSLALMGCEGTNPLTNPDDGTDDGTGGTTTDTSAIPGILAGDLVRISYDGASTLTVEINSLDDTPYTATYTRNAALDTNGYVGFSVQDDPLDRMFVAVVAQSGSGDLQAGVVSDGGQFGKYFSGGFYARASAANIPTSGQVSYAGNYAGISNLDAPGDNLLPTDPGTPPEAVPGEPARTQGSVFLNVNFADMAVNGTIYERSFVDAGYGTLPSLDLSPTSIDANGEFLGDIELSADPDNTVQGSYGGIFGGANGYDEVAGVIYLSNIFLDGDARDTDFDAEIGVFVLPRCGTAGAPSICDQVN